jgi:hypothetical protein
MCELDFSMLIMKEYKDFHWLNTSKYLEVNGDDTTAGELVAFEKGLLKAVTIIERAKHV